MNIKIGKQVKYITRRGTEQLAVIEAVSGHDVEIRIAHPNIAGNLRSYLWIEDRELELMQCA